MKKTTKLISAVLALFMFAAAFSGAIPGLEATITALAATTTTAAAPDPAILLAAQAAAYTTQVFKTPADKLSTMTLMQKTPDDLYELYYDKFSGEVGLKNTQTGQILFSNPYDVGADTSSASTKAQLLSQILIKYSDGTKNYDFDSFTQAATNGQINASLIKDGLRVEYTLGKQEARSLVPMMISKDDFQNQIMQFIPKDSDAYKKLMVYYSLKDINDPTNTQTQVVQMQVTWPITKSMPIYVFDPTASAREISEIEGYIKQYTKFTFEDMDAAYRKVGYSSSTASPPLFSLAIEYYLSDDGLRVRVPARGISFDASTYNIINFSILPFMGCTSRANTGYTFYPDGSGMLVRNEEAPANGLIITNQIYGPDWALYKKPNGHNDDLKMPVYGAITDMPIATFNAEATPGLLSPADTAAASTTTTTPAAAAATPAATPAATTPAATPAATPTDNTTTTDLGDGTVTVTQPPVAATTMSQGYFAIVTTGESTAELSSVCGGNLHGYDTVYGIFYPQPQDTIYSPSMGVSGISSFTRVAKQKYTGDYTIDYYMLCGDNASYVGMAQTYQKYLVGIGALKQEDNTSSQIPMYLETFGTINADVRILTFPAYLLVPLTTFGNIETIINDFEAKNITNINVKMMGWDNGGMYVRPPTGVRIPSVVGGASGFKDLLSFAKDKNVTIYPNINFASQISSDLVFSDFFNTKTKIAQRMDNTTAVVGEYRYWSQTFGSNGEMIFTAPAIQGYYNQTMKSYSKYDVGAIASDELGYLLTSDFRNHTPLTRVDSQNEVTGVFQQMQQDNGKVMVSDANAYSFPYITDITDFYIDSSRYLGASDTIPFMAMVLHGYINFTSTPINMEGDYTMAMLKTIENGAYPYFVLAYQNSAKLALSDFYMYYSIDFKTWFNDMVNIYNTINGALSGITNAQITDHQFLDPARQVVKVTYSNGVAIVINYGTTAYTYNGQNVSAMNFIVTQ